MPSVPVYDPGGTQRTNAMRPIQVSADTFGAAQGRALQNVGANISDVAGAFREEEQKNDAAQVMDAYTDGSRRIRQAMYAPETGLLNKQGANAKGVTQSAERTSETIGAEIMGGLKTDEQKLAFQRMWARKSESVGDTAAGFEFNQAKAARTEAKTSALSNIQDDVVVNYNSPKALAANMDAARAMIRANPDGLSDEGVKALERGSISALHLSVIQRMVQDSPGQALDYYEAHKAEVNGADHAKAYTIIDSVSRARSADTAVKDIASTGPTISIFKAVETAESAGDPTATSDAGAQGLMQVMPDTAREVAGQLGMKNVAAMTDEQLSTYWATPEGQKANRTIGASYLNKQLVANNGDLEAALIAYNAGPQNAEKFLNSGRDYSVLPKSSETYGYVKKVMGAYLGVDLSGKTEEEGSKGIQQAVRPGAVGNRYAGDSAAFLMTKLHKDKPASYINDMQPLLRDGLAAMMNDAPDYVKGGLDILSGARSNERQAELWAAALKKYGSPEAARKWVAPPGNSQHNKGSAADLGWNGGEYSGAPKEVKDWVAANATRYGLTFPLGNEDWHIETEGARKGARVNRDDVATARINQAFTDKPVEGRDAINDAMSQNIGRVATDGQGPSAAALYTQINQPFTVEQSKSNIDDWLDEARERYADNPPLLAEVERQLTQKWNGDVKDAEFQKDQLSKEVFGKILQGQSVKDMPVSVLQQLGEERVNKLITVETKFGKDGDDTSDEGTYYELSKLRPEQLKDIDLIDYADKLSKQDFKMWADRQAAVTRTNTKDEASSGMRTRTQIVSGMADTLGLKTEPGSEGAKTMALFNRAMDQSIAAYTAQNGKAPDAIEIQKLADGLVIEGTIQKDWATDPSKMVFELTPEEKANFTVAETVTDIPEDKQPAVATAYTKIFGDAPGEDPAVGFYNDMVRVGLGAAPEPPENLVPQIRQMFAKKYNRAPTAAEQADIYRRLILKATGQ